MRGLIFSGMLSLGIAFGGSALAAEQYVDSSGFALSGYDVVAYFSKEQADVGEAQPEPTPGKASITTEWNGATWAFASEENRDKFVANPEKFAPAYDGHCAYGVGINQGGKVPGNPNFWRIVDGTLYLNITKAVTGFWEEDIPGWIQKSEANWTSIESKPASTREIPKDFTPGLAPVSNPS